jgi:hypothetical protein
MSDTATDITIDTIPDTCKVVDANLHVFATELMQKAKEGWDIDPDIEVGCWGVLYEASLVRAKEAEGEDPKPEQTGARRGRKPKADLKPENESDATQVSTSQENG